MILTRLKAENYRNIIFADISFEKGVNLLFGENAQGKTNALECIYSFARGKSTFFTIYSEKQNPASAGSLNSSLLTTAVISLDASRKSKTCPLKRRKNWRMGSSANIKAMQKEKPGNSELRSKN